ncbi:hypothetical protein NVSP9465_02232 [Novosphingobium sp. CECT 9465]|nr:hypothetical protein NVSP9465_02232 [Novosphingobium sp. CECT 9465]
MQFGRAVLRLFDQPANPLANRLQPVHRILMKRGLYRTIDSFLGECAKVHESAGDAFPFLLPEIYDALGFSPAYNELPFRDGGADNSGRKFVRV